MKRITPTIKVWLFLSGLFLLPFLKANAQNITFDNNLIFQSNGSTSGGVCFNFTTSVNVVLENLRCNLSTANGTATIWFNPNKINGQPTINAANGWINLGAVQVTGGAAATNTTTRNVLTTIPLLLNLDVFAGDTIGLAIQWTGSNYPSNTITTPTASDGIVTMIADASCAFTFNTGMTSFFTPRQIIGGVIYRLKDIAPNDLGVAQLVAPTNFCSGNNDIKVKIKNFGNNVITSGTVNWSLDGILQTPINLAMNLDTFMSAGVSDTTITLTNYNFTNAAVELKAWTSMPNGVVDTSVINDTLTATLTPSMSGTYTVNAAQPTAGNNFQTLAELTSRLNAVGVCGPVVVNVVANSGPYTGKFELSNIPGASAANTIRINGNNNIVNVATAATNGQREMLLLENVHYVTIDGFEFKTTGVAAWGALITGGSSFDSLLNCKFDLSNITSTSSTSNSGIILSGTNSSVTSTGASGTNIAIINNHILGSNLAGGVYYGISLNTGADSIYVSNNKIENYYYYGLYIGGNVGSKFLKNEFTRINKTTGFTTNYGIYGAGATSTGNIIDGNLIHNNVAANTAMTSSSYGIYYLSDGTTAQPNIISNNVITDFRGGTLYGIYISAAINNKIYHNTINFNLNTNSTSANYGIYATGTNTASDIMNNIVTITAGGTGTKYGFYYSTRNSIGNAQKNNIYLNSPNAGAQNYGYLVSAYLTRAAFIGAQPTLEINSPTVDPQYMNAAAFNFTPTNAAVIAKGENLLTSVPVDYNGMPRTIVPTLGAFEKDLNSNNNLALLALANPTAPYCVDSQNIQVVVGNFGANNINSYKITGIYNNQPLDTFAFNSSLTTLNANATTAIDTITIGNLYTSAAAADLKLWVVSVNDLADGDASDDSLSASLQGTIFALNASEDTVCGTGNVRFSISPQIEDGSLVWEMQQAGGTWNTITGVTSSVFDTAIASNYLVRVKINKGVTGCITNEKSIVYITPVLNTVFGDSACVSAPMVLVANAAPGNTINWYSDPNSDNIIFTGDTLFLNNGLLESDTYYVASVINKTVGSVGPRNLGIGSSATSSNTYSTQFTVHKNLTLNSVDVYANALNLSSNIVIVNLETNQTIGTYPFTTTSTGTALANANVIPLNVTLAPGEYEIKLSNSIALHRNSTGAVYPYVSNGITINSHSNSFSTNGDDFYTFYNWKYETGCATSRKEVVAKVLETPDVNLGQDIDKCYAAGEFEFLNAQNPGSNFEWDNQSTNQVRIIEQTGEYYVTVTNNNGCFDSDTIKVNFKNSPISLLGNDTAVCRNTPLTLDAGPNGTEYYWSDGSNRQTTKIFSGGDYMVQIIGRNGCITQDTINVIMQGEAPKYDDIYVRNVNANSFKFSLLNPSSIDQVTWDFGDGNTSNALEPTHSYAQDGNYIITIRTQSSCGIRLDSTTVHIKGYTSVDDLDAARMIKVYPNPAKDVATIECINEADKIQRIELFDITGKQVKSIIVDNLAATQIDIANLANGMYQVNIITNKGSYKIKLDKLN